MESIFLENGFLERILNLIFEAIYQKDGGKKILTYVTTSLFLKKLIDIFTRDTIQY